MAADAIELEVGEVRALPAPRHDAITPLVARTDEVVGTGEELLVITPGKRGLRLLPYGSTFLNYYLDTNIPVFELPDGSKTDWHVEQTQTPEEPQAPDTDPDTI